MIRFEMHSNVDHFPDMVAGPGEKAIDCYCDTQIGKGDAARSRAVALLLEPKSLIPEPYEYCKKHPKEFAYIFTHDSELLKLDNARMFNWGSVWCRTDSEKTKGISLVSSWKNWCPLHNARLELAKKFDDSSLVDCFGSFRGDKEHWDDARIAHEHYRYAIVIENDIDDFWYTEKILNCFANKVVPIYVGATRIGEIFNADGIIQVRDWRDIPDIVAGLDIEKDYESRKEAIEDNFCRVTPYEVPWKQRFFADYGAILEALNAT